MFADAEVFTLIEYSGVRSMPNGWRVVIRAEWCDVTPGRPYGFSYALILQDQNEERLLGFDNSHAFDGARDEDPFDHEHRLGRFGQCFPYNFTSPSTLLTDFFDRVQRACSANNVPFEFQE